MDLIGFYSERGNGAVTEVVKRLWDIHGAKDNEDAVKRGQHALEGLKEVAHRKDHVQKLKAFLYDLITKEKTLQPQM